MKYLIPSGYTVSFAAGGMVYHIWILYGRAPVTWLMAIGVITIMFLIASTCDRYRKGA